MKDEPAPAGAADRAASFLVHVSSSESREIHAFVLDARTGALEPLEAVEVPGSGAPTRGNLPLAWSRDRTVLYAHVRIAPFPLCAYAVDPATGRLRLVQSVPMPAPLAYLSVTRDGRFLLGASYDDALLTVHRIAAYGRVDPTCLQTVATPPKAHCIVEAPFGGFVYATTVDGDAILAHRFDAATGRLADTATVTPARPGTGPRHLVFHPTLDRLYDIGERDGSVGTYDVDRTSGALRELQHEPLVPSDFALPAMGADLHVTPDGAFVYASVRKTDAITAFRVDPATGRLSRVGAFAVEPRPRGFAIDPGGRFLLCAGQASDHVAVYAIDPGSGGLEAVGRSAVGKRPSWVEIVPVPAGFERRR